MKNILFSGNNKVFDGVVTCMLSIFKRSTSEEPICFHIMTMDVSHLREDFVPISDKQINYLNEIAQSYNKENIIKKAKKNAQNRFPRRIIANTPLLRIFSYLQRRTNTHFY